LRTNGRISSRSVGVASVTNGMIALFARSSARAVGRSSSAVGPRTFAKASTLPSVRVVWRSAPGSLSTEAEMFGASEANARKTVAEESTSSVKSPSLEASSEFRPLSEEISRRRFLRRVATADVTRARSRWVGSKRSKTSRRLLPRFSSPRPAPLTRSLR
jgi:hypothetical protein